MMDWKKDGMMGNSQPKTKKKAVKQAAAIADSKKSSPPPAAPAPEEEVPQMDGEQKSAEELLSEFEKMLG